MADLVNDLTHTIWQAALCTNPARQDDPDFPECRMNRERSPIISTEEQRAWPAIRRHWTQLAEHGVGKADEVEGERESQTARRFDGLNRAEVSRPNRAIGYSPRNDPDRGDGGGRDPIRRRILSGPSAPGSLTAYGVGEASRSGAFTRAVSHNRFWRRVSSRRKAAGLSASYCWRNAAF